MDKKLLYFSLLFTQLFVTLKVCKIIDWSWKWTLSPLWIALGILGTFYILCVIIILVARPRTLEEKLSYIRFNKARRLVERYKDGHKNSTH